MRVWVDLANSPHVAVCAPVTEALEELGATVLVTARDHAQTLELARRRWPDLRAVGWESPAGLARKGAAIVGRASALVRIARAFAPDVAFAHGSYAQVVAARLLGVPAVTMMDYEGQPANHLSFRLARRVVVPAVFPEAALRRFGASTERMRRYDGFKEELYLAGFEPDPGVLAALGLDARRPLVVVRLAPEGALYQRTANLRVDRAVAVATAAGAQVVVLPRFSRDARRFRSVAGVTVPEHPVDGPSLLALADLVVGAGGTMTREAALLGTLTYSIFSGPAAAVDRELIRQGLLHELGNESLPPLARRRRRSGAPVAQRRRAEILEVVLAAISEAAGARRLEPVLAGSMP